MNRVEVAAKVATLEEAYQHVKDAEEVIHEIVNNTFRKCGFEVSDSLSESTWRWSNTLAQRLENYLDAMIARASRQDDEMIVAVYWFTYRICMKDETWIDHTTE